MHYLDQVMAELQNLARECDNVRYVIRDIEEMKRM